MGKKKEKTVKRDTAVTYKGKEYELAFNLNVMEVIQEEYGSVEAWGAVTDKDGESEPDIKALKFGLREMINEGIEIYNEDHKDKRELMTDKQVGRMITEIGLAEITNKVNGSVIESAGVSEEEKNS